MTPTLDKNNILAKALETHLRAVVKPIANHIDTDAAALHGSFHALGQQGWLAPKNPAEFGGMALEAREYQQFQQVIARYSGALAFLQTQHQSAASLLLSSDNDALKGAYLPGMATGDVRLGVGFSQLRRRPVPLSAEPAEGGGYRLTGTVPWVTGEGLFTEFVGAAALPDGSAIFGLIPLTTQAIAAGALTVAPPMLLAGMNATRTVEVQLENWLLTHEQVVGTRPKGWLEKRDRENPLSPMGLIFGCTQAAIDALKVALKRRDIDHEAAEQLSLKLAWLQMDLPRVMALSGVAYPQKLALRGRAISLMNTCTSAAIIAASGAANLSSHPVQRIYKESLVFSVSGQTTDGAITSLDSLLSSA